MKISGLYEIYIGKYLSGEILLTRECISKYKIIEM
jgi:hypothetical protein